MEIGDIDLLTHLLSVNVSLIKISQIMEQLKSPHAGTERFTPRIFMT
jgi:hypothetical protein